VARAPAQPIVESMLRQADAVFWLNAEGCINYVNQAACALLHYSPEDLLGRHAFEIEVGNAREQWPAYWNRIKERRAETVETRLRRRDGETVCVDAALCYLAFDGSEHVFCFARDIGVRKRADAALLASVEELKKTNRKLEEMQKIASLGQLAASSAQEIGNALGLVNASLGTLREYVTGLLALVALYERGEPLLLDGHEVLLNDIRKARETLDLAFLRDDAPRLLGESLDAMQRVRHIVQDLREHARSEASADNAGDASAGTEP
jgi:PAS domain S-box-containing protein